VLATFEGALAKSQSCNSGNPFVDKKKALEGMEPLSMSAMALASLASVVALTTTVVCGGIFPREKREAMMRNPRSGGGWTRLQRRKQAAPQPRRV